MTEKQKQAIQVLNRIKDISGLRTLTEEEYFLLLDFIVGKDDPVYVPTYPTYPYITWDTKLIPVTCHESTTTNLNKEEL